MKQFINHLKGSKFKFLVYFLSGLFLFFVSLYPDKYIQLPLLAQLSAASFFVGVNIFTSVFWDDFKVRFENRSLRKEINDITDKSTSILSAKEYELNELRSVIVQFLEFSEVFRDRIVKYLELNETYLCIAKSSEGLSDVFNALDVKQQLPFSKVLSNWPGSIKPFEKMQLYLLPISTLKRFKTTNTRKWINQNIIPKVKKEREEFLRNLPARKKRLAEDFSYKYISIVIRKNSIEYDSLHRKFNKSFVDNIIKHQSKKRIAKLTDRLTEVITAKNFFLLVDWSSFAKLNTEQRRLVKSKKQQLYEEFSKNNINTLIDISTISNEELEKIFRKVYRNQFTKKKYLNLAVKIISGTAHVLSVLRNAGVKI